MQYFNNFSYGNGAVTKELIKIKVKLKKNLFFSKFYLKNLRAILDAKITPAATKPANA